MSKKILIIDDNEGDRVLIRELVKESGIECEFINASSGEEGIEQVKTHKPDIVLLDTRLLKMDGFETCRSIKALENISTKIIMMTGVVDAVDASSARQMGADDYCVKTSDCASIIQAVKNLLN